MYTWRSSSQSPIARVLFGRPPLFRIAQDPLGYVVVKILTLQYLEMLASRFQRLASSGGPRCLSWNNAQRKIGSHSRTAPNVYKMSGVRLHSSHRLAEFTKKVAEGPSLGEFINGNETKVGS
jgi:hypothetical protein